MKKILLIILLISYFGFLQAQEIATVDYPKVGNPIKDHEFKDLDNYVSSSFKLSDFRGKWLVVDFWSRWCGGCIASFPKMNKLNNKFKDSVKILMIGTSTDSATKILYNRMKDTHSLNFTVAFDDDVQSKYDLGTLPTILVVNPEGIIVANTLSIDSNQLSELLKGNIPLFKRQFAAHERFEYNKSLPFLTSGKLENAGVDTAFLYRSMLSKYDYSYPFKNETISDPGSNAVKTGRMEVARLTLKELYLLAYFGNNFWSLQHFDYGKYSRDIILKLKDSSDFYNNIKTLDGYYAYSLILPPERSTANFMMETMQVDLKRFFGYNVDVKMVEMPAHLIIISDQEKAKRLKAENSESSINWNNPDFTGFGFKAKNKSLNEIKNIFRRSIPAEKLDWPIINNTGIDYNIDLSIDTDMMDLNKVNQILTSEYGLKIVEGTHKMKALVISE